VLTPKERQRAGPKGGAQAAAAVAIDPLGGISVIIDSLPQGQGHRTVTAQVVGDVFGLPASAVRVEAALDTGRDAWSIAAGNLFQPLWPARPPARLILRQRGCGISWHASLRHSSISAGRGAVCGRAASRRHKTRKTP